MKKILIGIFIIVMVLGVVGCASTPAEETNTTGPTEQTSDIEPTEITSKDSLENYPIVGMWQADNESGKGDYWRIRENGELTPEFVLMRSSTQTVNGVTSSSTSKSVQTMPAIPWKIEGENFMYSSYPFKMTFDGTDYKLIGEEATYVRVGDIDYEIPLDNHADSEDDTLKTIPYTIGETLTAEGIEMIFTESGFSDDIRVTGNRDSGIEITSGPSPEDDKQFYYLKGTLKNTGTQAVRPAIGGKVTLDEYEYNIIIDIINEDGTPCFTVEPLDSVIILIYSHIPIELTEKFTVGEMIFGFNDNFKDVDITNADYLYSVEAVKE